MQDRFRLLKCCYKNYFYLAKRCNGNTVAIIEGEIIAMENRLHGCVFVIVIGGIDII